MRRWLSSLAVGRLPELALALAAGYAIWSLAEAVTDLTTNVLAQHVGRDPSGEDGSVLGLLNLFSAPYSLNFEVGGTVIVYGQVLSAALALGLVAALALVVVRWRDRELVVCPFCASRIPYESTQCAYCGSGVELKGA